MAAYTLLDDKSCRNAAVFIIEHALKKYSFPSISLPRPGAGLPPPRNDAFTSTIASKGSQ